MSSKAKTILFVVFSIVAFIVFIVYRVIDSGITTPIDNKFGDQHLKTAVALIEMHKLRHGSYPESLSDLKFIGEWDKLALQRVEYFTNCDHTKYHIDVSRGWVAKPKFTMDVGFWDGLGYQADLQKCEK